jgi:hypothetical protein
MITDESFPVRQLVKVNVQQKATAIVLHKSDLLSSVCGFQLRLLSAAAAISQPERCLLFLA